MSKKDHSKRLLVSRFLTHSGDQAWDFAVPLTLAVIFTTNLELVALYYLVVRLGHMIFITRTSSLIDQWSRLRSVRAGVGVQTLSVLVSTLAISYIVSLMPITEIWTNHNLVYAFLALVAAGVCSSLGAAMMDIAVSQDWLPTIIAPEKLPWVNSRFKQIDLGTELGAPIVAGLMLSLKISGIPFFGFYLIALWNVVSFIPEYSILRGIHNADVVLGNKTILKAEKVRRSVLENLKIGWRDFLAQPASMAIASYALLWITVLSPHGVLLAAWLKTQWHLPESAIGLFRGLGAIFGLSATLLFPRLVLKVGLFSAARTFIVFEAVCLVAAGLFFSFGVQYVAYFALFILLSRIGLYGFSLGETEIKQKSIDPSVRGKVNGFAAALTSLATLGVYGAGTVLSKPNEFSYLVYGSIGFVVAGAILFCVWVARNSRVKIVKQ